MSLEPTNPGRFNAILDDVGLAIVRGELEVGHRTTVDGIAARTGASRSIAREATRVLVSIGLVTARRRVGLQVAPETKWDTLDVQVVRWRLASAAREDQLRELLELRLAIEPEAARLAAVRCTEDQAEKLWQVVAQLRSAGNTRDSTAFLNADRDLHGLILTLSGNSMFSRLHSVVDEALRERTPRELAAWGMADPDVALHEEMVSAIVARLPQRASAAMAQIARGN
jgi:DNA-binding FadR family transcriptional regulator